MGKALKDRRDRVFLMTKVCTHGRDARTAMRQLEQSLQRLQTDHLDLWQIHECVYDNEPEQHFARGGVVEALHKPGSRARSATSASPGTRIRAFTCAMLAHEFPFDSCQLPLNGFDASFRSFEQQVLPELHAPGHRSPGHEEPGRPVRRSRSGRCRSPMRCATR